MCVNNDLCAERNIRKRNSNNKKQTQILKDIFKGAVTSFVSFLCYSSKS